MIGFFEQLFRDGRVRVSGVEEASAGEIALVVQRVVDLEAEYRQHLPGIPPVVDVSSIEWSVTAFYRAAQLAVFRHLGPEEVTKLARMGDFNGPASASTVFSVDLVFRFLPDLGRIVHSINPDDPLQTLLCDWGRLWPLSSVGMPGLGQMDIEPILSDVCLSTLYADRILAFGDTGRLNDSRMVDIVKGFLGAYPELNPTVSEFLKAADSVSTENPSNE